MKFKKNKKDNKNKIYMVILGLIMIGFLVTQSFTFTDSTESMSLTLNTGDVKSIGSYMIDNVVNGLYEWDTTYPSGEIRTTYTPKLSFNLNNKLNEVFVTLATKNQNTVINYENYNIIPMGYSNKGLDKYGNVYRKNTFERIDLRFYFDQTKKLATPDYWVLNINLIKTDYPISTIARNNLFTSQNYQMPITVESFDNINGFIDVSYKYQNSIFPEIVRTYNTTFVKGTNTVMIPVPTQTEAKLEIQAKAGAYLNLDKEYKKYFTDTLEHFILINPRDITLNKSLCNDDCSGCDGYVLSQDKTICIDSTVDRLPCQQIGCPTGRTCDSSGYCTQFVTKFIDRNITLNDCELECNKLNGTCRLNANNDYYCVNELINEVIVELPTPIYIDKTCANFDLCSDGFECQDIYDTAQCVEIPKPSGLNKIPFSMIISFILIVMITGYFVFKGKK